MDLYSIKKYSKLVTYTTLILITIALISIFMFLMSKNDNFGNGNGLFMLLGSLYLIPIKILYKRPYRKSLVILYTSWVYTGLAFTIGVQLARLFPEQHLALIVLISQTVIYSVTLYVFNKLLRKIYANILNFITDKICIRYLCTVLLMYLSIISVNYAFVTDSKPFALISFILFGLMSTFSLYFIFSMVLTKKDNEELGKLSYYDSVTDCKNRNGLLISFDEYQKKTESFSIAFIDLDQFKKINDIYGHNDGDEYLFDFTRLMIDLIQDKADFFRLHGDEFILLSILKGNELHTLLTQCNDKLMKSFPKHDFLGFSVGVTDINDKKLSLDEALAHADVRLYEEKNLKQHYRNN